MTADEARRIFLAQLPQADFAPLESAVAALSAELGLPLPVSMDSTVRTSRALDEEIDEFARAYWKLTPAERSEKWFALDSRNPRTASAAFLHHLSRALDLVPTERADPHLDELSIAIRESFVLRPRARGDRRRRWEVETDPWREGWFAAINRLRGSDAATADLVAKVGVELRGKGLQPTSAATQRQKLEAKWVEEDRNAHKRKRPAMQTESTNRGGWGQRGIGCGAIFAIILVIRVIAALMKSGLNNTPPRGR